MPVYTLLILQLKYSKHPVCSFWYDFGVNIYFDVLQKSGQSITYDQLWKFANKIQHFSMETLVSWQSMNSCSNNSSVATVTEVLEVPITNIMFYFVVFAEKSIHVELSSSIKSLKTTITSCFNIPSERFRYFTNWNFFFARIKWRISLERNRMPASFAFSSFRFLSYLFHVPTPDCELNNPCKDPGKDLVSEVIPSMIL